MILDNKYEITFSWKLNKKIFHVFVYLGTLLKTDLGKGIQDQIFANLHGYVDDNIPLF